MPQPIPRPFEVGKRYGCNSPGDHNCWWYFTVIARTARFVTLRDDQGAVTRRGVRTYTAGVECLSPLGVYSLSPVLTSDSEVVAR